MRSVFFFLILWLNAIVVLSQKGKEVSQQKMQEIYEEVKTPYKYGLVLVPENDSQKIDCPTVFRKGNTWYMSYLQFDGRGYETWLAKSNDLLHWKKMGRIMSHSKDTMEWDANQKAGYIALVDTKWNGKYSLKKYKNKYWMSYFGGKEKGYEAGLLSLGIAYTKKELSKVHEWKRLSKPVLSSLDKDVRWWENKKQFKSTVIYDEKKATGYPFVMYYNANGDTATDNKKTRWFERIGMAVSDDMVHWKRFKNDPVVHHPVGITGDPMLQKIGDVWVMFYFGAFWQDRKGAFNRFACSYDLVNWTDWNGDNLIGPSEPYDELYAHKPSVIKYDGVVYHFYCAVNKKEQRGIAVATSKDLGKSNLSFISE
jgi:predicted GH43/DUF377 family glycosyl hydrolase